MAVVRAFRLRRLTGLTAVFCLAQSAPGLCADFEAKKAPAPHIEWAGLYAGGHFGYGDGSFGDATSPQLNQAMFLPATLTGMIGGYQIGYNFVFDRFVLGLEADASFPSPLDERATNTAPFHTTIDYVATARARAGYAFGRFLPFVTGGIALGHSRVNVYDSQGDLFDSNSATQWGWTIGGGVEYALDARWRFKIEYDRLEFASASLISSYATLSRVNVSPELHVLKLGLNYRIGDRDTAAPVSAVLQAPKSPDWDFHAQTTFIQQGYPQFRSPYQGQNSLPGSGLGRETWTNTVFLGWRLWDGGEFYFNPELAQGFGIGNTLGLGGFANGEAQKGGNTYPHIRAQRYFLRQTFGLGGEQESVEAGPNQLADKRDVDRVTITVGRFAVGDIFDANAYAHDPRVDFMNWALWSSVAYDFPADLPGFTRGAVIELNRKDWALRAAWLQVPEQPNSDVLTFKTGGAVVEFEQRYDLMGRPGKLRLGSFYNVGRTGNYNEATAAALANPSVDINDAITADRRQRPKYGAYVNLEQSLTQDVGLFARASWNDGQNEILSFTDVDRSLSGGLSIKGASWSRPDDTVGLGAALNGLSAAHRNFLANGGYGLLIGDGALTYSRETIFESYYSWKIDPVSALTLDYQFVENPAYNAARGPVHILAGRFHAEF